LVEGNRAKKGRDAAAIAGIYRPIVESTIISFEEIAPSVAQTRERIETTLARWPWLAAARNGDLLGYVYASEHRARAAYRERLAGLPGLELTWDEGAVERGAASLLLWATPVPPSMSPPAPHATDRLQQTMHPAQWRTPRSN